MPAREGYETHGRISTVKRYRVSTGAEDAAQRTTYNYDTAVNGWGRVASVVTGQGYTEAFEYSTGGLVTKKSLTAPGALRALAAVFGYDNEGKRTSLKYPDLTNDAGDVAFTGKTVTSGFDSFGRPVSLNDGTDVVRNGAWSLAGQLTGMEVRNGAVYEARTWTYNALGQLTGQTATGVNLEYTYPAVNDGRLLKRKDNISGEEVAY
ncbi:MAG: hypothetical protein HZB13_10270, partial [Acidobacteria bacterium]|nr:hypothetical protein [Acidobacteriota bacterium]